MHSSGFTCPYQVLMGIFDNFCATMGLVVMLDHLSLPERFDFNSGLSHSGCCSLCKFFCMLHKIKEIPLFSKVD